MAESEGSTTTTATVRIEVAPPGLMPDGLSVVPVEHDGGLVWAVRPGEMSDDLVAEFNHLLGHITHSGLWRQHWPEDPQDTPPGHPH